MYKKKKNIYLVSIYTLAAIFFITLTFLLNPFSKITETGTYAFILTAILFVVVFFAANQFSKFTLNYLRKSILESGENVLLNDFMDKLRFCYSLEDFYDAVINLLEKQGDCSVIFIDKSKNYVLYNSPSRNSNSETIRTKIDQNFNENWPDGFYFFDRHIGVTSKIKKARGFFICYDKQQFYVFCKYTRLFDEAVFERFYEEYMRFISRMRTIATLSEISDTTKEWEQLAVTQQSFLPQKIPNIPKLKIATYYRPLVNVSGDYYSILPIDQNKTLLMLGDVSGKGLPAALIMGLVMNTVKIIEDKDDLPGVLHSVDKAIKSMHLQDKYTVLFLGIVDTEKMRIRYINASMSDPIILSPSPDGYRFKPLTSNASLVGILDVGDVQVAEKRLFRGDTILIATDGVSEVMDDNGVELGDTDIYKKTLIAGASKTPQAFVDDIVDLIMKYNGNKKLHDDVTMMIAKVGY